MRLKDYLELFTVEYNIRITTSDGTKFYLKGDVLL